MSLELARLTELPFNSAALTFLANFLGLLSLTQRAILNKALDSIDRAGGRFWGAGGVYSRRRTAVDAVLRTWAADGGLPAELSGM